MEVERGRDRPGTTVQVEGWGQESVREERNMGLEEATRFCLDRGLWRMRVDGVPDQGSHY